MKSAKSIKKKNFRNDKPIGNSFKYKSKYRKIIVNLINAPALQVVLDLCFVKENIQFDDQLIKIRSLYQEVLLIKTFLN